MKICNLTRDNGTYTSNVYLITGTWNAIPDVNTLIDVGRDSAMLNYLRIASTGVGKKRVARVILTHSHYDHASLMHEVKKEFDSEICAYSRSLEGLDKHLRDGERLLCGDREFEVMHVPLHSEDSICLYNHEDHVLFAGDTPLVIRGADHSVPADFITFMERLAFLQPESIYFGHGEPILKNALKTIEHSLNVLLCHA